MTIKKRLRFVLILPFTLLMIVTALFMYSYSSLSIMEKREIFYTSLKEDFYQLSFLNNDIAMYPKQERARFQWHEKFLKIKLALENWNIQPSGEIAKDKIYKEYMELLNVYNKVVKAHSDLNQTEFTDLTEYRKRMIGQMQIRMYSINTNMIQLIREMRLHMLKQQYYYNNLMFGTIFLFILLLSWMTWHLIMNILHPLQKLHGGVEKIAKGDFDYDIELNTNDEFEDFSKTLDTMTNNFTSAISQLSDEVLKRQENEKSLEQMNQQLKELDRLKTLFIASMSHELRTPLNAIIGFSSVLNAEMAGPLNEKQKDHLGRIHRAGKHLLSMIIEVIDISKIESNQIPFTPESFSLNQLIGELVEKLETLGKKKGITLRFEYSKEIIVYTDRDRMKQVLENYITNAIKYSEHGDITISAQERDEFLEIEVKDCGIGIADEDKEKLFQPFERLESPMRVLAGGTGLGLYLTKKIVEDLMHGEVYVQSTLGKGSRFGIRIPLHQVNLQREEDVIR